MKKLQKQFYLQNLLVIIAACIVFYGCGKKSEQNKIENNSHKNIISDLVANKQNKKNKESVNINNNLVVDEISKKINDYDNILAYNNKSEKNKNDNIFLNSIVNSVTNNCLSLNDALCQIYPLDRHNPTQLLKVVNIFLETLALTDKQRANLEDDKIHLLTQIGKYKKAVNLCWKAVEHYQNIEPKSAASIAIRGGDISYKVHDEKSRLSFYLKARELIDPPTKETGKTYGCATLFAAMTLRKADRHDEALKIVNECLKRNLSGKGWNNELHKLKDKLNKDIITKNKKMIK